MQQRDDEGVDMQQTKDAHHAEERESTNRRHRCRKERNSREQYEYPVRRP